MSKVSNSALDASVFANACHSRAFVSALLIFSSFSFIARSNSSMRFVNVSIAFAFASFAFANASSFSSTRFLAFSSICLSNARANSACFFVSFLDISSSASFTLFNASVTRSISLSAVVVVGSSSSFVETTFFFALFTSRSLVGVLVVVVVRSLLQRFTCARIDALLSVIKGEFVLRSLSGDIGKSR